MSKQNLEQLSDLQKIQYFTAKSILSELTRRGYLVNTSLGGDVIDFGCGSGGSCLAFREHGAKVVGVDTSEKSIDELVNSGILPVDKAINGDGVSYLKTQPENSTDIVAAFLFGPPYVFTSNPQLLSDFYTQANRVINPSGKIIITSDEKTFGQIAERIGKYGQVVDLNESTAGFGSNQVFIGAKQPSVYIRKMETPFDTIKDRKNNPFLGIISSIHDKQKYKN